METPTSVPTVANSNEKAKVGKFLITRPEDVVDNDDSDDEPDSGRKRRTDCSFILAHPRDVKWDFDSDDEMLGEISWEEGLGACLTVPDRKRYSTNSWGSRSTEASSICPRSTVPRSTGRCSTSRHTSFSPVETHRDGDGHLVAGAASLRRLSTNRMDEGTRFEMMTELAPSRSFGLSRVTLGLARVRAPSEIDSHADTNSTRVDSRSSFDVRSDTQYSFNLSIGHGNEECRSFCGSDSTSERSYNEDDVVAPPSPKVKRLEGGRFVRHRTHPTSPASIE